MPRTLPSYITQAILAHHAAALVAVNRAKADATSAIQRLELQIAGERIAMATEQLLAYTLADVAVEPVRAEAA